MKTNNFFGMLILASAVMIAASCSKNDKDDVKAPTSAVLKQVRDNALKDIIQTKTFKAEDGITFTSKGGVQVNVNPNSLCLNGNPVTGEVALEFAELYKRGDMLVVNKPLMGTGYSGEGPMSTGGQFYIKVSQNGQELSACGFNAYTLNVPTANTGGLQNGMTFWTGTPNSRACQKIDSPARACIP